MSTIADKKTININSSTFRETVKIPPLPENTNELLKLPAIEMHKLEAVEGRLQFKNSVILDEILRTGFFLLKIPANLDLEGCDKFAANFYKEKDGSVNDKYKGYKNIQVPGEYQGYFDRPYDQWENFYIESSNWEMVPKDVQKAGIQMAELGINIIKSILLEIGIPENEWEEITGGLTAHKGHQMLAFNHFRPEKNVRGTKLHRDSGWVTVLRSTEPGLVALVGEELYAINPIPGYFIINFGSTFEVLTKNCTNPVRANIHGVIKTLKKGCESMDRKSYVIFLDSDLSGHVYQYHNNQVIAVQTMKDFAVQEVSRTYNDEAYL